MQCIPDHSHQRHPLNMCRPCCSGVLRHHRRVPRECSRAFQPRTAPVRRRRPPLDKCMGRVHGRVAATAPLPLSHTPTPPPHRRRPLRPPLCRRRASRVDDRRLRLRKLGALCRHCSRQHWRRHACQLLPPARRVLRPPVRPPAPLPHGIFQHPPECSAACAGVVTGRRGRVHACRGDAGRHRLPA